MDRLTSLTVFARVVESGGFSAAARRLNMSATMVTNHIQSLEDRLGARLLNRTTRKTSLTEIGQAYYERCTQVLADLEEADRIAGALQSTPRGTLRLYVGTHITRFVAPVVAEFLSLYPEASIDLTMGERMVDLLGEGVDLAIRPTPPPDSSLIVRSLARWRHVLCASPGYLAQHGVPQRPEELVGHNCLRYVYYPFGDEWQFTGPGGRPVSVRVAGNLLTSSAETLRLVALSAQGLFLAPSFIVEEDLRGGGLVEVLGDHSPAEFAINAIYPHRYHLSAKVRCFIDLTAAHFSRQPNWLRSGTLA
jgi:DNA-binding transcriptional LysR family regulator